MIRTLMVCSAVWLLGCEDAVAPPDLGEVGAFELVDDRGERFTAADLGGSPWVANVIFTTCPSVCPLLTSQMSNLERRTRGKSVRFLSVTVDPQTDTPEVLTAYAEAHDANLDRWRFLTGEEAEVHRFVMQNLKLRVGERTSSGDITHGSHFVLIDASGHHRSFYRTDAEGLAALESALAALD